jgi:nicotinamide-nucleotide amidase
MTTLSTNARVSLLSIGDELLLGEIIDTNQPYIAQSLLPLGLRIVGAETVGDEMDDIIAAFQRALARADIVIATGGLGPTDDDLTMEAVARLAKVDLVFHEEVMEQMAARLKRPVSALTGSNRKQANLPRGSNVLKNDWGTAPGVHFPTADKKHIFLMAGVPREMKGILGERIIPWLKVNFPSGVAIAVKKLHAFGIGESIIGERIKPMMQAGQNPDVGTRVAGGVCTVRIVAHAATPAEAQQLLLPCPDKVRAALSEGLFGEDDDTLQAATLKALLARKKTVAFAECCTAGLAASIFAETPGSSAALMEGSVVYSNAAKCRSCGVKPETLEKFGAVSAETAAELAAGIRAHAKTDIGISVTGIAGPGGGTETKPVGLVWFGVSTTKGTQTIERKFAGVDRNILRERAAMQALDLLRRAALEA